MENSQLLLLFELPVQFPPPLSAPFPCWRPQPSMQKPPRITDKQARAGRISLFRAQLSCKFTAGILQTRRCELQARRHLWNRRCDRPRHGSQPERRRRESSISLRQFRYVEQCLFKLRALSLHNTHSPDLSLMAIREIRPGCTGIESLVLSIRPASREASASEAKAKDGFYRLASVKLVTGISPLQQHITAQFASFFDMNRLHVASLTGSSTSTPLRSKAS